MRSLHTSPLNSTRKHPAVVCYPAMSRLVFHAEQQNRTLLFYFYSRVAKHIFTRQYIIIIPVRVLVPLYHIVYVYCIVCTGYFSIMNNITFEKFTFLLQHTLMYKCKNKLLPEVLIFTIEKIKKKFLFRMVRW